MSDGGKGSAPRPFSVDQEKFASNWDAIFGKKNKEEFEVNSLDPDERDWYYDNHGIKRKRKINEYK